jgi:diguanylate cyclase (GGDEF)-like protein
LDHHNKQKECPHISNGCPIAGEIQRLKEECERLRALSQHDSLTGLFNFSYLMNTLGTEMERTRRAGLSTGLIMIDLDHFKRINDKFGHEAGNKSLQWFSRVLRDNLRRIDIPCRYGGEEFAIILPGIRLSQGVQAAERLRLSLKDTPIHLDDKIINITASFGVDTYGGREDLSVETFLKRTDRFLLQAKKMGRNRVCYDRNKITIVPTEVTTEEKDLLLSLRSSDQSS